ncbi:hypothetical protein GGI12_000556 [Dipsacomyces acuminosporus]|nr:hypothetical protein GGI12_000556 [Dipsacomyces acuminosporus]
MIVCYVLTSMHVDVAQQPVQAINLLDKEEFDYLLGEKRLLDAIDQTTESYSQSRIDSALNRTFMQEHKYSVGCAGALLGYMQAKPCAEPPAIAYISIVKLCSGVIDGMQQALSKVKGVRAVCSRIQTELLVSDLETLVHFAHSIVKLHHIISSLDSAPVLLQEFLSVSQRRFGHLGSLIVDIVDFDASRQEGRVVIARGVSSKVDYLREKFNSLHDTLFQTDKQSYYKNEITRVLDKSPGDVFSLVVDAEAEVCLELQQHLRSHTKEIANAFELASAVDW